MIKNISQLEHIIADKAYRFICDMDAPIEHVKECLFQFLKYVGQIEDASKAKIEADKKVAEHEEKKEEPLCVDCTGEIKG